MTVINTIDDARALTDEELLDLDLENSRRVFYLVYGRSDDLSGKILKPKVEVEAKCQDDCVNPYHFEEVEAQDESE